jgi:GTPase
MFVDEATLTVTSGSGGPGAVSFLREANNPKGGPDGGDGGNGGNVWIVAEAQKNTLVDFRHVHNLKAPRGTPGGTANCTGARGKDLIVLVPPGTLVLLAEDSTLIADLDHRGARYCAAKGGRGGRGNARFATSRNRAPRHAQPGEPGEELSIRLELKLLADVGIIGKPSVGKSTLISRISSSRPRIAAYPFTTLVPNLGVVEKFPSCPFVVADVPGLIEGASEGKGLGHQFLKHIQRTTVLLHMLDALDEDIMSSYESIRTELGAYDSKLLDKPEIVVINKVDAVSEDLTEGLAQAVKIFTERKIPVLEISAVTGKDVDRLLNGLARLLQRQWQSQSEDGETP